MGFSTVFVWTIEFSLSKEKQIQQFEDKNYKKEKLIKELKLGEQSSPTLLCNILHFESSFRSAFRFLSRLLWVRLHLNLVKNYLWAQIQNAMQWTTEKMFKCWFKVIMTLKNV